MRRNMTSDDLTVRAIVAYYRAAQRDGIPVPDQPANNSDVIDHQGKRYVVLSNVRGPLAVYRIRPSGALKRLKRWPAEVAKR
jgi:hypothetical protein